MTFTGTHPYDRHLSLDMSHKATSFVCNQYLPRSTAIIRHFDNLNLFIGDIIIASSVAYVSHYGSNKFFTTTDKVTSNIF
jgi:hypothetical protein